MTNHWRDIRHADLILINGANPAEAHPVGFRWFVKAKVERGAKIIHVDPRFTRTSAVADNHPRSVLNLMRKHYSRYTPEMVERITGIPRAQFLEVAKLVGEMGRPDKVMTQVYAVGLTHHTTGSQMIRAGAVPQP